MIQEYLILCVLPQQMDQRKFVFFRFSFEHAQQKVVDVCRKVLPQNRNHKNINLI